MSKVVLLSGIGLAMLSVILGAFAAHGLKTKIAPEMVAVFQTGVQYQFYHALALIVLGLLIKQMPLAGGLLWAAGLLVAGVILFSGSLYGLALTGSKWLGPITPIGGACFIVGWLLMFIVVLKGEL